MIEPLYSPEQVRNAFPESLGRLTLPKDNGNRPFAERSMHIDARLFRFVCGAGEKSVQNSCSPAPSQVAG